MMPLSSSLQQHWQTVIERLPELTLSPQAQSVLTFSDFVCDSLIAHPDWLTALEREPVRADEWQRYADLLQTTLAGVQDEAGLMRELK
jgi:[glutamine synthetase] adenylyltransferase / [glutamine synthetase]-adenylyl-L-tyrosine phosphorylase